MDKQLVAKASIAIHAPIASVWEALTNPETIKQYMFGTNIIALAQDNNANEQAREHSEKNWGMMLASLKKLLENSP